VESYGSKVALVLLALCPNIVVSTAIQLLTPALQRDLHATQTGLQLAAGLSNAAYAFGAVLAAGMRQKLPPRRLLLGYELVFVVGSTLVAVTPGIAGFTVGRVLQGLGTGLLLVAALPPLVTNFPATKLPVTVAVINIGLFGAVTVGPLVGGLVGAQSSPLAWRLFFAGLAVLGLIAYYLAVVSVEHQEPLNPEHSLDKTGLVLAAAGTALPFYAVSELTGSSVLSVRVLPALVVGLCCLVALVLVEYGRAEPLMPVRLLSHTFPVTGILGAMLAGASYVALLELAQVFLVTVQRATPLAAGLLFWPNVVGILVAAVIFGALFRTRFVPVLATAGMVVLAAGGGALLTLTVGSGHAVILIAAGALGFGAGATVSPGLFLAALAVPSSRLGEAFALVELLRSEAAFLVGPVLLYVATSAGISGRALTSGITTGVWVAIGLVVAGTVANIALFYAGGARLHAPDLEAWVGRGEHALESPAVAAAVRQR
jgi:MFS family permease